MSVKKPAGEETLRKITGAPPTSEEKPEARARPRVQFRSRTFMLLVLCALLLVGELCVLFFLFPFVLCALLPGVDDCQPRSVQVSISIEELCLSPKQFALVRVRNCSGDTLWYFGSLHQYPTYWVEYLVGGERIWWDFGNIAVSEEKIPLRPDETFLFVVPLSWRGPPESQPEEVRVGIRMYRDRWAPGDESYSFLTAPRKLQ